MPLVNGQTPREFNGDLFISTNVQFQSIWGRGGAAGTMLSLSVTDFKNKSLMIMTEMLLVVYKQ